jgi:hypothetical protein
MKIRGQQVLFLLSLLIAVAASLLPSPVAVRIPLYFFLLFYIPGLALLALVGDPERPPTDDLFLPLLLSPPLVVSIVVGAHSLGLTLGDAMRYSPIVFPLILFAVSIARPPSDRTIQPQMRGWWILLTPVLFAGTIALMYASNTLLLSRSDAWTHACYINEIIDRGIPPMEPCLPDTPLHYMWSYHLFVASFIRTSGTGTFQAMGAFNVVVAFVFPYLIARIAALFTTSRRHVALVPLFAIAGLESACWIMWPLNFLTVLFGSVKGADEVSRILGKVALHSPDIIQSLRSNWTWMVSTLDKFLTITVFGYTMDLFLLGFLVVVTAAGAKSRWLRSFLLMIFLIASTCAFHIVTGIALALTAAGSGLAYCVLAFTRWRDPAWRFHGLLVPMASIVALAAISPYVLSLMPGKSGGAGLLENVQLGTTSLLTIIAPLVILFPFALASIRKISSDFRGIRMTLGIWILTLIPFNIIIDLPGVNESKLIFPLFLLLVIPLSVELIDRFSDRRRRIRILSLSAAFVLFAVPSILTMRGFLLARPKTVEEARRNEISEEDKTTFRWITSNTPADAVMIERNDYRLMPVLTHRRNFFPDRQIIKTMGYGGAKIERLAEIRDRFFSCDPMEDEDIVFISQIGKHYFVLLWSEDVALLPCLEQKYSDQPEFFEMVYESRQLKIFEVRRRENG